MHLDFLKHNLYTLLKNGGEGEDSVLHFLIFDYLRPLPKHNPVMLYNNKCFIPFSSPLDHECLHKTEIIHPETSG